MNKVVSINLNGIVFNIEEQAYERLKSYIDRLRRHFQETEGSAEIIADIESRIAELLQLKLNERYTVIQMTDVDEVIAMMGDPGQIDGEETNSDTYEQSSAKNWSPRRLRRDPRNKVLGGVCAGVSNYMGIDPIVPRALFLISFFVFGTGLLLYVILWIALPQANVFDLPDNPNFRAKRLFRNPDQKTIGGVCSGIAAYMGIDTVWIRLAFLVSVFVFGSGILLYLILWVAIPLARTSAEKLQMKGEPIDVSNIERKVREAFTTSGRPFMKSDGNTAPSQLGRGVDMAGQAATQVLRLAGRIFGFVVTTIGITLLVALLMLVLDAGHVDHMKDFGRMFAGSDKVFYAATLGAALFLVSIALSFLIGGIKLLFNLRFRMKGFNILFSLMCFVGILVSVYAAGSYAMTIDEEESVTEKIYTEKAPDTLYLSVANRWHEATKKPWVNIHAGHRSQGCAMRVLDDEGVVLINGKLFIQPSVDQSMQVTVLKGARGGDDSEAMDNAKGIDYRVVHKESQLTFDAGVLIPAGTAFKYQRAAVKMKVPVGTIVKADREVRAMINRTRNYDDRLRNGGLFKMTANGLVCLDCEDVTESDWDGHEEESHDDHLDIEVDDDEPGEKKVKIRIGKDGHDSREENVIVETTTDEDGNEKRVKTKVTKVGPVTIEETISTDDEKVKKPGR